MNFFKKHWWKFLIGVPLSIIILIAIFAFNVMHMSFTSIDADNPPKFIQAHVVNPDKITTVSKFRSGAGHDFSVGSGETCRSMKHYFMTWDPRSEQGVRKEDMKYPVNGTDPTIFSPVDGKIDRIEHGETWVDDEIIIVAESQPNIRIRLMHVTPMPGIKPGLVTAGQEIGLASISFDVAMERIVFPTKVQYISYFAAMPDEIFAKYQSLGIKNKDEFIISREYRDANPLSCKPGTEEFVLSNTLTVDNSTANYVYLKGK